MDVLIEKIILNKEGVLFVKPKNYSFDMIYRSAMGVHWDKNESLLYHNLPKDWNNLRWYRQIISAVKGEYGVTLKVDSKTVYENIDEKVKTAIESE